MTEVKQKTTRRHGMTSSSEYRVWASIKNRCYNKKQNDYIYHGGLGITMSEEWKDSFEAFYKDVGPKPSKDHVLGRKDTNGNYEPGNCEWITKDKLVNNRKNNVVYEYLGIKKTIAQWARSHGIPYDKLRNRLSYGWDIVKALTTP